MNFYLLTSYNIFQILMLSALGVASIYIFVFSFAGLFYHDPLLIEAKRFRKIAVLIPGYKEDEVIIEVAMEALQQNYPNDSFDVVIVADSFHPDTIEKLRMLPIKVLEVSFEKSTKSKALNKVMDWLTNDYDIAIVLDADNIMSTNFLSQINRVFERDFIAVQGHRTAKNMNTSLAILDAASEEINNHIFRKGHRVLGLSSAIIGSGMAFNYGFFKKLMLTVDAVGGFDKEIELKMLKAGHKIEYLDQAYVYDEKVQKAEVFSNQRRRWLSAQLHYFRQDFLNAFKELLTKGNIDYFDKAFQFIQPPRILLLGSLMIFGALFFITNLVVENILDYNTLWISVFITCMMAFVFAIPKSFYNLKTFRALLSLPKGMMLMLFSLLKIKGANKQFIHTKHTSAGNANQQN
jgi:cellulose synthase/poly-beta-1,6-N-acetylglucosamine synthase-like glycosyltransferase